MQEAHEMKIDEFSASFLKSKARDLLGVTRFAMDSTGIIIEIDKNIKAYLGWEPGQMISKNIMDFISTRAEQRYEEVKESFLKWETGDVARRNISIHMKVNVPSGKELTTRSPETLLVGDYNHDKLIVQGVFIWELKHSVKSRRINSVLSTTEMGYVFLDSQGKILGFDGTFIEYAKIYAKNLEEIRDVPLKNFVDPYYISENWLNDEPVVEYLKEVADNSTNPWKQIYSMQHKSARKIQQEWLLSPFCVSKFSKGILSLSSKKEARGENYVILNTPVNTPDNDLRVTFECASPKPSDLSPILGGSNVSNYSSPDQYGYFFGFGCDGTRNSFQRKFVEVLSNSSIIPQPDVWHQCELERVGGQFRFSVNGTLVFEYYDPQPQFQASQYFSFYYFSLKAGIRNVAVYTRKSILNYEKIARMNVHRVVFKNNPNKLFEMRWTIGYWHRNHARLVLFKDVSFDLNAEAQRKLQKQETKNLRLEHAKNYIVENYKRNINFKELCKNYHMSYAHFITTFTKNHGMPPKNYQINLRLRRAKEMLGFGQHKIKDIALLIGYEDELTFYQLFMRHEGISPTEYMKRHSLNRQS